MGGITDGRPIPARGFSRRRRTILLFHSGAWAGRANFFVFSDGGALPRRPTDGGWPVLVLRMTVRQTQSCEFTLFYLTLGGSLNSSDKARIGEVFAISFLNS